MCCVNEFADLIHTLEWVCRRTGLSLSLFLSCPSHMTSWPFFIAMFVFTCLSSQTRCSRGAVYVGVKRNNATGLLARRARCLWVSAAQGRKGLRSEWEGMLRARLLQNIAVFVRRQVISRNTADTAPQALWNLWRPKWLAGVRSNKVFFFFFAFFLLDWNSAVAMHRHGRVFPCVLCQALRCLPARHFWDLLLFSWAANCSCLFWM